MSKERQIDILLVFFWHWQWCQGAPKAMAPMPECPQTHVSSAGVPQDQSHWCWVPPSAPWLLVLDGFYDHQGVNKNKTPFWWRRECASSGRGLCGAESSNQPACTACTACVFKDRQFFASWQKADFFLGKIHSRDKVPQQWSIIGGIWQHFIANFCSW